MIRMRPLSALFVSAAFAICCCAGIAIRCAAAADHQDMHYADISGALCRASSFAHGFLHGYEDGFHEADQNVQLGRIYRMPGLGKEMAPTHPSFTPDGVHRELFMRGYRAGFEDGYSDSVSGREFRAVEYLRSVAGGVTPVHMNRIFDGGFADGFKAGVGSEHAMTIDYVAGYCRGVQKQDPEQYCAGYSRGFEVGFASSHTAPAGTTTTAAAGSR
jgi:hypothetical protein